MTFSVKVTRHPVQPCCAIRGRKIRLAQASSAVPVTDSLRCRAIRPAIVPRSRAPFRATHLSRRQLSHGDAAAALTRAGSQQRGDARQHPVVRHASSAREKRPVGAGGLEGSRSRSRCDGDASGNSARLPSSVRCRRRAPCRWPARKRRVDPAWPPPRLDETASSPPSPRAPLPTAQPVPCTARRRGIQAGPMVADGDATSRSSLRARTTPARSPSPRPPKPLY